MSLAVRCETKILYVISRQTATVLQGLTYGVEREHPLLFTKCHCKSETDDLLIIEKTKNNTPVLRPIFFKHLWVEQMFKLW